MLLCLYISPVLQKADTISINILQVVFSFSSVVHLLSKNVNHYIESLYR